MLYFRSRLTNGPVAEWLGRALQKLLQRFESARDLQKTYKAYNLIGLVVLIYSFMKYSQFAGIVAAIALIAVCFIPWSFIASKNILITGMQATGTSFGRPGYMHIVLTVAMLIFFSISRVWAKRTNVFIAALNLAWSVRNYLLVTGCLMGDCPEKRPGIFLLIVLSAFILLMTFFPKIKMPAANQ